MDSNRSILFSALLGCGLFLGVGCGPHGDCGCTPAPSATVQGRITDTQGNPVAGVDVSAVQVAGSDPGHQSTYVVAKSVTRADGSFDLRASLGQLRLLVRAQVGATVYLPSLGPEFELRTPNMALAGMDLTLTATQPASLTVDITPLHGAQQEDNLVLEQILTLGGVDYSLPVASLKPAITGDQETVSFLKQPPGVYALSLWRSETTGTHAMSGTAKVSVVLLEGATLSQPLAVK